MKILHTSDWHLGKKLDTFSRLNEQRAVLNEITQIAANEEVDAVLIAGDLYDTFNPQVEAIELFYQTLKKLSRNGTCPVIAIAGNHDSPDRIEAPDPLAREMAIILAGYPVSKIRPFKNDSGVELVKSKEGFIEIKLPKYEYPLRIILNPYANQYRIKKYLGIENEESELREVLQNDWQETANTYCDDKGVNILLSHMFFVANEKETIEEPDEEKPILHLGGVQSLYQENIPAQIQYAALGHLHRRQIVAQKPCPIVYSGSTLSYSFSEAGQQKFVEIVNLQPGKQAVLKPVALQEGKQLLRKSFNNIDKAVKWLEQNTESLIELTIISENYLTANDRKRLKSAHPNIINIIPQVLSSSETEKLKNTTIDINKNMNELFADYFQYKTGQKPNDELMNLFKELNEL